MKENEKNEHLLEAAYHVETFRNTAHELIDLLSDHLLKGQQQKSKVLKYQHPDKELDFWKQQSKTNDTLSLFKSIIQHSINVQHPNFMGHQVAAPALMSGLSSLLVDVLGNGTGVYEMGMASNAIEKIVTDKIAGFIGFNTQSCGHLTSGGTLANLTAMLAARKAKAPNNVWLDGHQQHRLAIMVSEEAHYCIDRAARILGMGNEGIIKIPVNEQFKMKTGLLESYYNDAEEKGLKIIAIVGSACSTATGSYDDLEAISQFAQQHHIWFHVDGAHGGGVIFSNTYKHLAKGIEQADSVVIDFHKMLMTPSLTTALIFKDAVQSYQTFQQQANYLWNDSTTHEWHNSSKRTFECTKLMMSIKIFTLTQTYGWEIFEANVDCLYDLGKAFAKLIKANDAFELAVEPETNIVNFRYCNAPIEQLDDINRRVRQRIVEAGKFYIVQTVLKKQVFLRCSIMNPLTTPQNLQALLAEIKSLV